MYDIEQHILEVNDQFFSARANGADAATEMHKTYAVIGTHLTFYDIREPPDGYERVNDNLVGMLSEAQYDVNRLIAGYESYDPNTLNSAFTNFNATMNDIEDMDFTESW